MAIYNMRQMTVRTDEGENTYLTGNKVINIMEMFPDIDNTGGTPIPPNYIANLFNNGLLKDGDTLYWPAGTYRCSGWIDIRQKEFTMLGDECTIIWDYEDNQPFMFNFLNADGGVVKGITFFAGDEVPLEKALFARNNSTRLTFEKCIFMRNSDVSLARGLLLNGSQKDIIKQCRFDKCMLTFINCDDEIVENCDFTSQYTNMQIQGCEDVTVTNIHINGNRNNDTIWVQNTRNLVIRNVHSSREDGTFWAIGSFTGGSEAPNVEKLILENVQLSNLKINNIPEVILEGYSGALTINYQNIYEAIHAFIGSSIHETTLSVKDSYSATFFGTAFVGDPPASFHGIDEAGKMWNLT